MQQDDLVEVAKIIAYEKYQCPWDNLSIPTQNIYKNKAKAAISIIEANKAKGNDTMAEKFLMELAKTGGRIVCTGDLLDLQILEARVDKRIYVEQSGIGFVILPWELSTQKDKARELKFEHICVNEDLIKSTPPTPDSNKE